MKINTADSKSKTGRAERSAGKQKAKEISETREPGSSTKSEFKSAGAKKGAAIDAGAKQVSGPAVRTGTQLLRSGEWNGKGVEPRPSYFTDQGGPSPLWKAILSSPKLEAYSKKMDERVMLTLKTVQRNAKGNFDATVEIYADHQDKRNSTVSVKDIPASAALGQLAKQKGTGAEPVLPFPLGVYTKQGSSVSYPEISARQDPELLAQVARFLHTPMTQTAYSPSSPVYDAIGEHKLFAISIDSVDVNVYGEVRVRYTPTYADYNMDDVHDDGLRFRMLHVDAPAATSQSIELSPAELAAKGRPRVLDSTAAAIAEALGQG